MATNEIALRHTYAIVGGEVAIPLREFFDEGGSPWMEAIFVRGHAETVERHPTPEFLDLILQEVTMEPHRGGS
jgi:hypothetical protein